ncbi:unnamed protein product, partial [Medioppia subpectinata]
PYLWWKRYITRLQLIQFAILIVCLICGLMCGNHNDYPIAVILCQFLFINIHYVGIYDKWELRKLSMIQIVPMATDTRLFLALNLCQRMVIKSMNFDSIQYILHDYWAEETDDRLKEYRLLKGGPELFLSIMLFWLLFVTKLGPNYMKDRKPFVLREIIMIYNFILVVINVYFVYAAIGWLDYGRKSWLTRLPTRNEWSEKAIADLPEKAVYAYSKLFDLFDTVFFVLRKKSNQITFLHVYHHFMVPVLAFIVAKLCPQTVIVEVFCLLNSIVHTVMYSYYLLSAFGPQIQPYLWWKRYITRLQ